MKENWDKEALEEIEHNLKEEFECYDINVIMQTDKTAPDYNKEFLPIRFYISDVYEPDISIEVYVDKCYNLHVNRYEDIYDQVSDSYS